MELEDGVRRWAEDGGGRRGQKMGSNLEFELC